MSILKASIKKAPKTPGVYFFEDSSGTLIYIGKASNLKNRLSSYFVKNAQLYGAKESLIENIHKIYWQTCESEAEALILEANLIKKFQPQYNVLMRDDKTYFYVAINKEIFPKIKLIHRSQAENNIKLIGPFTDGKAIKQTLKFLRKALPYCTCSKKHKRPCLNYQIGKCAGICCIESNSKYKFLTQKPTYRKNIKSIELILLGQKQAILKKLTRTMEKASQDKQYEKALVAKDQIYSLNNIFSHRKIFTDEGQTIKRISDLGELLKIPIPFRIEGYDISNISGTHAVGSMVVFLNGQPDKSEYKKFKIKNIKGANDVWMLKETLSRRLNHPEWKLPDLILIDGGRAQLNIARLALSQAKKEIHVISLAKKEEVIFTPYKCIMLNRYSSALQLLQHVRDEAHRFALNYHRNLRKRQLTLHNKVDNI